MSHWGKFSDAVEGLRAHREPKFIDTNHRVARTLEFAPRFYLPNAAHILEGKEFTDIQSLLRLPYPIIAVLSDVFKGERKYEWTITLAADALEVRKTYGGSLRLSDGYEIQAGDLHITPIDKIHNGDWIVRPDMFVRMNGPGAPETALMDTAYTQFLISVFANVDNAEKQFLKLGTRNVDSVFNLCALLNLANVRTENVPAPIALNRKRARNHRLPLYDYHVLVVDGERWTTAHDRDGTGPGFRSHLRRGHIRHLHDTRAVWVRAAYVHGRIPGFVDKEYRVDPHAQN